MMLPFIGEYSTTQTYQEHKARAIANGWCYEPGAGCTSYYYGGVDFATPVGIPILASDAGKVNLSTTDTSPSGGYGKYIKIAHTGGLITLYGHLSSLIVATGNSVTQGQVIGYSGYSGNVYPAGANGAHLHWEVRSNGIPVDPMLYVDAHVPATPIATGVVCVNGLRIRNKPSTSGNVLGFLYDGDDVTIYGVGGEVWVQIDPNVEKWVAAKIGNIDYIQNIEIAAKK